MITNPAKTCNVMWPASMLANNRTLWETGLDRNDKTSMATMAGRISFGTPFGTKRLRKCRPFRQNP
jgi:hypothetical protein